MSAHTLTLPGQLEISGTATLELAPRIGEEIAVTVGDKQWTVVVVELRKDDYYGNIRWIAAAKA